MNRLFTLVFISVLAAASGFAQTETVWNLNSLKKIGGVKVTVLGNPGIDKSKQGKSIVFNGIDDGVFLETNPIENSKAFTIEAIFRPDGGTTEQRWFHIQQDNSENRVLLETRLVGAEWFLDTYIKSGENNRALLAENFKHPVGAWYHVALVYDGSEMRHYVDGKLELAGPLTIAPIAQGQTSIGVRMNRVYWFKGAVRKARFTMTALSPHEFMGKN